MADSKPSSNAYKLLGGVNTKSSDYDVDRATFENLRNLDFFKPNALSKRPGSTQMVTGTSGPINSIFEFQKLNGASYIVAGSDTAMFYLTASGYTLLSSGWSNGQPTDMLAYADKLWMANGQKWQYFDGTTVAPVGLPFQQALVVPALSDFNGASYFLVGGATHWPNQPGGTFTLRGVYVAYSYVRTDGYIGPADFLKSARNVVISRPFTSGDEFFDVTTGYAPGITIPSGYGISAIQLWVGADTVHGADGGSTGYLGVTWGTQYIGALGWNDQSGGTSLRRMSYSLHPTADLTRFHLWTAIPGGSLFLASGLTGYPLGSAGSLYSATLLLKSPNKTFADINSVATGDGFSGMPTDFFTTFTPKYIEQNQNVMFASGFSAAPSIVAFSEIGQPEYFKPQNNFEVRTNDGDVITGTKTYNNVVIVTKERSFSKIIGSTPSDLALVELSTEFGNISNGSMVEYNQRLGWLDRRGWLEFNGSTWNIISTPVEPIFRRMNLTAAKEKACAVNHQYRNQVWIGIPIDGSTTNNFTVVYDYLVGSWTFFDGFNPASFALAKGSLSTPSVYMGDFSGIVHSFGESLFGDNGRGISCVGFPSWEIDRGQQSTSLWRRFFLDVQPNSSGVTGSIPIKVYADYDASAVRATFTMYQSVFQSKAEFGVPAKAISCEFGHFSASLPLVINGFSWTKRFLRNV